MSNSDSLLSNYQALVQNHANRFDPEIAAVEQKGLILGKSQHI